MFRHVPFFYFYFMKRGEFFCRQLLKWHDEKNHREMPWKSERDPYKIWLSEIILQQTRVEQGRSYYLKFISKFPTIHDLASATQDTVLQMWEGLGYYSRARNLHETARHISEELGGEFPVTYKGLLTLKGVGPYTAAAIGSFAFQLPTPVVDGNSLRLVMRFEGEEIPINEHRGKAFVQQFLSEALPGDQPAAFNQALMDFGATVCKPKAPLCEICPFQSRCKAYRSQRVHRLPVKKKAKAKTHRYFHYLLIHKDDRILIEKRSEQDIWRGLFQFPMLETPDNQEPGEYQLAERLNLPSPSVEFEFISHQTQTLSHRFIHAYFYKCKPDQEWADDLDGMWVSESNLPNYGLPKVIREFLNTKQKSLF